MANTTMADQPNAQGFEYYRYDPSMAAAIIFTILFFFTTLIHFYQFVRTRTWIMIPLLVGGFCISPPSPSTSQFPLVCIKADQQFRSRMDRIRRARSLGTPDAGLHAGSVCGAGHVHLGSTGLVRSDHIHGARANHHAL